VGWEDHVFVGHANALYSLTDTHPHSDVWRCVGALLWATLHGLNDCCLGAVSVTVAVTVAVTVTVPAAVTVTVAQTEKIAKMTEGEGGIAG